MALPPHRFTVSAELAAELESKRYRGRWADVKGIAEENAALASALPQLWTEVTYVTAEGGSAKPGRSSDRAGSHDENRSYSETTVCVANVDTLTATLVLSGSGGGCAALSHGHHEVPGGRYLHGGRAQEEDLCRCMPQLHPSLVACAAEGAG